MPQDPLAELQLLQLASSQEPDERPLKAMHLDALHPEHLQPLTEPFELFSFDFAHPPEPCGRVAHVQVSLESGSRRASRMRCIMHAMLTVPRNRAILAAHIVLHFDRVFLCWVCRYQRSRQYVVARCLLPSVN